MSIYNLIQDVVSGEKSFQVKLEASLPGGWMNPAI
jgi:hypothetical protein